jgi:hypothetical protein
MLCWQDDEDEDGKSMKWVPVVVSCWLDGRVSFVHATYTRLPRAEKVEEVLGLY